VNGKIRAEAVVSALEMSGGNVTTGGLSTNDYSDLTLPAKESEAKAGSPG
jgi:hypothetical protein